MILDAIRQLTVLEEGTSALEEKGMHSLRLKSHLKSLGVKEGSARMTTSIFDEMVMATSTFEEMGMTNCTFEEMGMTIHPDYILYIM